jgi:hypothetical protein
LAKTSKLAPSSLCGKTVVSESPVHGKEQTHLLLKQAGKLFSTVLETKTIGSVDDPDQGICLLEVVAPVAP